MEGLLYKENFCEENIWHLGAALCTSRNPPAGGEPKWVDPGDFDVLFLSGVQGNIPIFAQKKGTFHRPVWWDYHVILLDNQENQVFDFDSRLAFPCPLLNYLDISLEPGSVFEEKWHPMVRPVPLKIYLERFHSDRSHMRDDKGNQLAPFPEWPPIMVSENPLILNELRKVGKKIENLRDFFPWHFLRNLNKS